MSVRKDLEGAEPLEPPTSEKDQGFTSGNLKIAMEHV
jgi:hypothetical protein